jgi:hypothetical protein
MLILFSFPPPLFCCADFFDDPVDCERLHFG